MFKQKINYRFNNEILITMKSNKDYMFLCAGTLDNSLENMYRFINSIEENFLGKASLIEVFPSEKDHISKYIKNLLNYHNDDHEIKRLSLMDNKKDIVEINNYILDHLPNENYGIQQDQNKFTIDDGIEFEKKFPTINSDSSWKQSNHTDYLKTQNKKRRAKVCICVLFLIIVLLFLLVVFHCGGYAFNSCF